MLYFKTNLLDRAEKIVKHALIYFPSKLHKILLRMQQWYSDSHDSIFLDPQNAFRIN